MGVFVYVCIWFTHQSSSIMSLTWWGAQHGLTTCEICFRPLLESDVTSGGWGWGGWKHHNLSQCWVHLRVILEGDSVHIMVGELCEQIFNRVLMTCCKWHMIQNTTEWIVIHCSAGKINILYCKLTLCPSGSLISTYNTCISSSHCGQRATCCSLWLQPSVYSPLILTLVLNSMGYHPIPGFLKLKMHTIVFWVDTTSFMAPFKLSAHLWRSM